MEGDSHLDDEAILAYEGNHVTPTRHDEDDDQFLTTDEEDEDDSQ